MTKPKKATPRASFTYEGQINGHNVSISTDFPGATIEDLQILVRWAADLENRLRGEPGTLKPKRPRQGLTLTPPQPLRTSAGLRVEDSGKKARNEEPAAYRVTRELPIRLDKASEEGRDAIIAAALDILAGRARKPGAFLDSPTAARDYMRLKLGGLDHEVFGVAFLDATHRVIEFREMFRGTLTQATVYPREVAKEALTLNAAAVILAHNHPSGATEASRADEMLTTEIRLCLGHFDVKVLDHLIVTAEGFYSFAEHGKI